MKSVLHEQHVTMLDGLQTYKRSLIGREVFAKCQCTNPNEKQTLVDQVQFKALNGYDDFYRRIRIFSHQLLLPYSGVLYLTEPS